MADDDGTIYDHPGLLMAGQSWDRPVPPAGRKDTILAPEGMQVAFLPGRRPVGLDPGSGQPEVVERFEVDGRTFAPHAVAAILPPGHLRHLLPATEPTPDAPALPLRSWCAVGLTGDKLRVAASRVDPATHWDPARFSGPDLQAGLAEVQARFPDNRVVAQLARCASEYYCCTASNIFLGDFEGGLPVADSCNANCIGCISEQTAPLVSPQQRLAEPPPVEDLIELGVHHLQRATKAMISFGQGCEGEPLTQAERIIRAIAGIRSRTTRGTIHMNTNGSAPEAVADLAAAGLQSVRVSLISARAEAFDAYHRAPFGIDTVEAFCTRAASAGLHVALNLLVFPGFTDRPGEIAALVDFIQRTRAHMVQLRNLDVDPARLMRRLPPASGEPVGMRAFLQRLLERIPDLDVGSFNRFAEDWGPRAPARGGSQS